MIQRDAWARVTPYELGIPGRDFADRVFAAIDEEMESRGVDGTDPGAFFQLGEVGRALREIQGEERGGDAIERFAAFLFHAWHFHRAGEVLLLLGTDAARAAVSVAGAALPPGAGTEVHRDGTADAVSVANSDAETDPVTVVQWDGTLPADAGYLQLPRHLFWSHPDAEGPAEPIDGFFWVRTAGETLALLVALGVRGDRPGISVVELPPLPLAEATHWVAGGAREDGADFATTLPGGELDDLYSVVTLGEVLTLAGRVFGTLHHAPEILGPEERSPRPEELEGERGGGPGRAPGRAPGGVHGGARPSFLPFRRISGAASIPSPPAPDPSPPAPDPSPPAPDPSPPTPAPSPEAEDAERSP